MLIKIILLNLLFPSGILAYISTNVRVRMYIVLYTHTYLFVIFCQFVQVLVKLSAANLLIMIKGVCNCLHQLEFSTYNSSILLNGVQLSVHLYIVKNKTLLLSVFTKLLLISLVLSRMKSIKSGMLNL